MNERPSGARGRDVWRYVLALPVAFVLGLGWGSPSTDRADQGPATTIVEQRIALTPEQNEKLERLLAEVRAMNDDEQEQAELTPQERQIVDETAELLEGLAPSSVDPPALVVPTPTAPPTTTPPATVAPSYDDWVEPAPATTTSTAP